MYRVATLVSTEKAAKDLLLLTTKKHPTQFCFASHCDCSAMPLNVTVEQAPSLRLCLSLLMLRLHVEESQSSTSRRPFGPMIRRQGYGSWPLSFGRETSPHRVGHRITPWSVHSRQSPASQGCDWPPFQDVMATCHPPLMLETLRKHHPTHSVPSDSSGSNSVDIGNPGRSLSAENHRKPVRVRTLRTKLGVSWRRLATS